MPFRVTFHLSEWLRSETVVRADTGEDVGQGVQSSLLVELQTFTHTLEIDLVVSQKIGNLSS